LVTPRTKGNTMLAAKSGLCAPSRAPAARRADRIQVRAAKDASGLALGREWLGTLLSRFGPTTDRATNITTLEFEKPLVELDRRIREV
jgi:acetyl-CoA carboxylase carboxyl transferase subunit alpha